MPIPILASVMNMRFVSQYYVQVGVAFLVIMTVRAYFQGQTTDRERNLHGRVMIITGGFTPVGLTLIEALAQRGAHIIALSPDPLGTPQTELIIDALRTSTKNERIFAEHCDTTSPASIRAFCTRFVSSQDQRIDALVFAHEYEHIGTLLTKGDNAVEEAYRRTNSLSTFLLVTLLLPPLLVAPAERDIRIVIVINPFYAAALPTFLQTLPSVQRERPTKPQSLFQREGFRALRTAILTRHLQRVLDALPAAPALDPDAPGAAAQTRLQKSNIVAVSVSPGISRTDTIAPMLYATKNAVAFRIGLTLYLILLPLWHVLFKTPFRATQSVLHALFLPTPFKRALSATEKSSSAKEAPEELLKPGALYAECAIVRVPLPKLAAGATPSSDVHGKLGEKSSSTSAGWAIPDDGEFGGEELGRHVWEEYEAELMDWEKEEEKLKVGIDAQTKAKGKEVAAPGNSIEPEADDMSDCLR